MNAIIITIGDEILVGQTIDTNSAYIAKSLNQLGIKVKEIISIADTSAHITTSLDKIIPHTDFVIITGGLGPTNDDITKKVLTNYFGDKLVLYPEILERIKSFFVRFNKPFLEVNQLQAMLPQKATIIPNELGTASGMWFKSGQCNIFSMPGVPYEMRGLMDQFCGEIKEKYPIGNFYHRTVQVIGIGESYFADLLKGWEAKNLAQKITVSYLPSVGTLKLRLTGLLDQQTIIDAHIEELFEKHSKYVIGEEFETIEVVLKNRLEASNQTLGTVESCTGGSIAKKIVSLPGSSSFYSGSIVSYTNELKASLVGVKEDTLKENGAVSEKVVVEMAENGRLKLGTDYCISVSGIAGPTGGSDEKPIGTVWVAIATPQKTHAKRFNFGHTRERNIKATVLASLNYLRLIIEGKFE